MEVARRRLLPCDPFGPAERAAGRCVYSSKFWSIRCDLFASVVDARLSLVVEAETERAEGNKLALGAKSCVFLLLKSFFLDSWSCFGLRPGRVRALAHGIWHMGKKVRTASRMIK